MGCCLRRPLRNLSINPTAAPITLTSLLSQDGRGGKRGGDESYAKVFIKGKGIRGMGSRLRGSKSRGGVVVEGMGVGDGRGQPQGIAPTEVVGGLGFHPHLNPLPSRERRGRRGFS